MTNTPPTFAWYVADLVFQYLLDMGGLESMAEINQRKSSKLCPANVLCDNARPPVQDHGAICPAPGPLAIHQHGCYSTRIVYV